MASLGVYVGNDGNGVTKFEKWLGRDVDFVAGHGGGSTWQAVKNTFVWLDAQFAATNEPIYWTVPMLVSGGNLAAGSSGSYDANYKSIAQTLAALGAGEDKIHIRVGQEFNGNWFSWAAKGREAQYISTFQHFVNSFRSVSDKFVFEWNVNAGDMGMNPALAYPGDKYVDFIGMDFYYNTQWDPADPNKAWDFVLNREYGLKWLEDFADAHDKPSAYSEWSINSDNSGDYVKKVAAWFASHDVAYQSYYDSNGDFPGKLSEGQYGNTGKAFIAAFGGTSSSASPSPAPSVASTSAPTASAAWVTWAGGSDGDDWMTGDSRANKIDGRGGTDTMQGLGGDDSYTVDRSGDKVVESAGQGIDTVDSFAGTYTLAAHVEHLNLVGSYAQNGYGNGLDNRMTGNAYANILMGRGGDDWLTGGGGSDTFVFTRAGGHDTVTDFSSADRLDFTELAFSSATQFLSAVSQTSAGVEIDLPDGGSVLLLGASVSDVNGHFLL